MIDKYLKLKLFCTCTFLFENFRNKSKNLLTLIIEITHKSIKYALQKEETFMSPETTPDTMVFLSTKYQVLDKQFHPDFWDNAI